jgi:hypothetical protein
MEKTLCPQDIDQGRLFPPADRGLPRRPLLRQSRGGGRRALEGLVPADHLVHFVRDVVLEEPDLSQVYAHCEERRGYPP